jgi:hypothetical protein
MTFRERSFKLTRRVSKYANKPTDFAGAKYHSRFEAQYARDLALRQQAGEVKLWRRQVKIPLFAHGVHVCDYWIDFVVELATGETEYVEVKGFATDVWRLKWKLFEAQMRLMDPSARLIVVKR